MRPLLYPASLYGHAGGGDGGGDIYSAIVVVDMVAVWWYLMVESHTKAVNYVDPYLVLIALTQPVSSSKLLPPALMKSVFINGKLYRISCLQITVRCSISQGC